MDTPGLLITSGKGGVGKTLLSTNLAIELSKKHRIALIDADIRSPNMTYVMGIEPHTINILDDRDIEPYKYSDNLQLFSTDQFFHRSSGRKRAIMPTGEEVRTIVTQAILSVKWNKPDLYVMDSDPSTGDVFIAIRNVFGDMLNAIVVTTNRLSSLNDCERTIDALMKNNINVIGVVGNMIVDGKDEGIKDLIYRCNMNYHADISYLGYIPMDNSIADENDKGDPGLVGSELIRKISAGIMHEV